MGCRCFEVAWSYFVYLVRETVRERRDSRRGCVPARLPVVSCVLALKSLIINTIHFSGMYAIAGWLRSLVFIRCPTLLEVWDTVIDV